MKYTLLSELPDASNFGEDYDRAEAEMVASSKVRQAYVPPAEAGMYPVGNNVSALVGGGYKPYVENYEFPQASVSCISVADHTEGCMVCSRLYRNDNTMLIIVIVFLGVVNLLLIKRILENRQ